MIVLRQIACFIMWLAVIPTVVGLIPSYALEKGKKKIGTLFLLGWVTMLAVFQLLAVPMVLTKQSLSTLVFVYSTTIYLIFLAGVFVLLVGCSAESFSDFVYIPKLRNSDRQERITWHIFVILLLFQIFMSLGLSTPNGDDAYYVSHAVIADVKDTMYLENAYTGAYGNLDARHVLAPFSMFIAFLARISGMHGAAVAHVVLPIPLILLTYLIFFKISTILFPDEERDRRVVFMVLIAGVQLFGNYSVYTNENFFLLRTWQGKSVLANIAIPLSFYWMLRICTRTERHRTEAEKKFGTSLKGIFLMLLLTNLVGALASSLGLLLLVVLESVITVIIAVRNKNYRIVPGTALSLLPCMIYMILYILL